MAKIVHRESEDGVMYQEGIPMSLGTVLAIVGAVIGWLIGFLAGEELEYSGWIEWNHELKAQAPTSVSITFVFGWVLCMACLASLIGVI